MPRTSKRWSFLPGFCFPPLPSSSRSSRSISWATGSAMRPTLTCRRKILARPSAPVATRGSVDASTNGRLIMQIETRPLLSVRNLRTSFFQDEGTTKAVDGASFDVSPGKTLGIVGERGCGKRWTAQSILRIVDRPGRIVEGEIVLTRADGSQVDLVKLKAAGRGMRPRGAG